MFTDCPDCGSSHLGGRCGMTFGERMRTVQVDKAKFDTSELHNYYDRDAITDMFGHDAKDRYYEETDGRGATFRGRDGALYRRDRHSGDVVAAEARDVDVSV